MGSEICIRDRASPEVAAAAALTGVLCDPRDLGAYPEIEMPEKFFINDNMIVRPLPLEQTKKVQVCYGPNIKPLPAFLPLSLIHI